MHGGLGLYSTAGREQTLMHEVALGLGLEDCFCPRVQVNEERLLELRCLPKGLERWIAQRPRLSSQYSHSALQHP